jgi:hypothetical protein
MVNKNGRGGGRLGGPRKWNSLGPLYLNPVLITTLSNFTTHPYKGQVVKYWLNLAIMGMSLNFFVQHANLEMYVFFSFIYNL